MGLTLSTPGLVIHKYELGSNSEQFRNSAKDEGRNAEDLKNVVKKLEENNQAATGGRKDYYEILVEVSITSRCFILYYITILRHRCVMHIQLPRSVNVCVGNHKRDNVSKCLHDKA